ncbi:hypothetical protein BV25DRAFT_1918696 [Artomyces pyxidatus]|uniref:Uncharacterized protein n=1 Tax=Artomyces pyxidatus TaxID=48021 RepID=A0ACB8SS90_9AGAM|nr:hypothetical protein BV25DRAFT_1918696 [Artomyces pyxidatus]
MSEKASLTRNSRRPVFSVATLKRDLCSTPSLSGSRRAPPSVPTASEHDNQGGGDNDARISKNRGHTSRTLSRTLQTLKPSHFRQGTAVPQQRLYLHIPASYDHLHTLTQPTPYSLPPDIPQVGTDSDVSMVGLGIDLPILSLASPDSLADHSKFGVSSYRSPRSLMSKPFLLPTSHPASPSPISPLPPPLSKPFASQIPPRDHTATTMRPDIVIDRDDQLLQMKLPAPVTAEDMPANCWMNDDAHSHSMSPL